MRTDGKTEPPTFYFKGDYIMPLFGLNFPWDQPAKPQYLNLIRQPVGEEFKKIMLQYDPDGKETLALVLCGGGLFGSHEFAEIYRLWELGVLARVKFIVGTSVGALNACLTAKFFNDMDKGLKVWEGITKNNDVYDGSMDTGFTNIIGDLWAIKSGAPAFLNPRGLYALIDKLFKGTYLDGFEVPVITTASRLRDGKDMYVKGHVDTVACVRTSAAMFPCLPAAKDHEGALCIDGGLGQNMPIEAAIREGATKIILIGTSPDVVPDVEPKNNIMDVAGRLLPNIMKKFEDNAWEWIEEYKKNKDNRTVEFLSSYPDKDLGNVLSAKETYDRIRLGYAQACQDFTADKVKELLLT